MSRKRTPDLPASEAEPANPPPAAEPESAANGELKQSFAERVGQRKERVAAPDPFGIAGDYVAGVRLFDSKQDRQMVIKFDEKPSQPVIDKMKEAGYRWNGPDKVWTHPASMSARIEAERLYQEVRQMIRKEKGIETGQEIPF
jgi:hypothetical protein